MAELRRRRSNVRLNLASTPENVVLVREMLSGLAQAIGLDQSDLNDIRTAVTEACNNVVLHAYQDEQGSLEVEACIDEDVFNILVRDRGTGIQSRAEADGANSVGIGLHVIQTLTRAVDFDKVAGGGTEVRMEFDTPGTTRLDSLSEGEADLPALALAGSATAATVNITPISLARTVLPRMVSALAARAHFSTDRISDAQLLADAIVAHAHSAVSGDHLNIDMNIEPRDLELRIAPLGVGRAQRLIGDSTVEGLGKVIEKLTDRHGVVVAGQYETLTLGLVDRR